LLSVSASADEGRRRLGLGLAISGGVAFGAVYLATAVSTAVGDGMCGLNNGPGSCSAADYHPRLYIPLVGGFINATERNDVSRNIGIASSVVQIGGVGVMVAGIVLAATHRPSTVRPIVPYASATSLGLIGRF
jgi:hypothetical protein